MYQPLPPRVDLRTSPSCLLGGQVSSPSLCPYLFFGRAHSIDPCLGLDPGFFGLGPALVPDPGLCPALDLFLAPSFCRVKIQVKNGLCSVLLKFKNVAYIIGSIIELVSARVLPPNLRAEYAPTSLPLLLVLLSLQTPTLFLGSNGFLEKEKRWDRKGRYFKIAKE